MIKKGIILAGGSGTRLYPMTAVITKQLLPVYNKPLIFYPLSTLMSTGIRDILIISQSRNLPLFQELLGDGSDLGISLHYAVQNEPRGIAEAFIVGQTFLNGDGANLILGDNIFYGTGMKEQLLAAAKQPKGATIFGYRVTDPERYGVAVLDSTNTHVTAVEEKPANPKSNIAITGLYFYDSTVVERAKQLKPSARGELEITDLNNSYIADGLMHLQQIDSGVAWLDTGTFDSLLQAGQFVEVIEKRQGLKIACLEEIAYSNGFISREQLEARIHRLAKTEYGHYLQGLLT